MTDDNDVQETWKHDGGENAIILQPGVNEIKSEAIIDGPTLYQTSYVQTKGKAFECSIGLREVVENGTVGNDADVTNKFGGMPTFLQGEEYPSSEKWDLLIQLDSTNLPFSVNFGDAGVGYGFINSDGNKSEISMAVLLA